MKNEAHACLVSWYPKLSVVLLPLPSISCLRGVWCWDCFEDHLKNKVFNFISQCIPFSTHRREQENQQDKKLVSLLPKLLCMGGS